MVSRLAIIPVLLICLSSCSRTDLRQPSAPECLEDELRAIREAGSLDPIAYAIDRLREHDVLVVGEYHRLVPQILFVAELIRKAGEAGIQFDLGMEMMPAGRQPELDRLLDAREFDHTSYYRIVDGLWLLAVAAIKNYMEPVRAAWEVNRSGKNSIRVIGLGPDCSFDSKPDRRAILECEDDRDAFMARTAKSQVLDNGRKLILYAGNRHAAVRLFFREDGNPVSNVATIMEEQRPGRVFSIWLAGPCWAVESESTPRHQGMCGGLFELIHQRLGSVPFAVDLTVPPLKDLQLRCDPGMSQYFREDMPLHEAYQGLVYLQSPKDMDPPSALPLEAFELMKDTGIPRWNRYLVEVLKRPSSFMKRGPREWHEVTVRETAACARFRLRRPDFCEAGQKYKTGE